jgi:hypothetical protein
MAKKTTAPTKKKKTSAPKRATKQKKTQTIGIAPPKSAPPRRSPHARGPTVAERAKNITKAWMDKHRGWTPEEMISRLIMIMNKDQLDEIMGANPIDDESDGRLEGEAWRIERSNIHGLGLFSKNNHQEGTPLFPVLDLSKLHQTFAMNHINHSDDPSVVILANGAFAFAVTKKEMKEGEEFTVNYTELPWLMIFDRTKPKKRKLGGRVPPRPGKDDPEEA